MNTNNKDINERVATLEAVVQNICSDIKEIKDKLLGRPSWGVSVVITLLTTICCGLSVYLLTNV